MAAAIGGVALFASAVTGTLTLDDAPPPFVWRDVMVVGFLSALPLAATLAAIIRCPGVWRSSLAVVTVETLALVAVPMLYREARWRSDSARLTGLVEQSRWGEARQLADRMLLLQRRAKWNGRDLSYAAADIHRMVEYLDSRAKQLLPRDAAELDRLGRARELAMLGRTDDALRVLDANPNLFNSPVASNLRGTIYETKSKWRLALKWYSQAGLACQSLDDSPPRSAALQQALTGIAYCERKLGHLPAAELAYQELLEMSPAADTHYLMAQFYEDTQQASQSQFHARMAMTIDPDRYDRRGQQLIDRLMINHFGCGGVYARQAQADTRADVTGP